MRTRAWTLAALLGCAIGCGARGGESRGAAARAFQRGDYQEAVELYEAALVRSSGEEALRHNLGLALAARALDTEDSAEREALLLRALGLFRRVRSSADLSLEAEATYAMGTCLVELGQDGQALDAYRRTLLLDPDDEDARYNLEVLLRRMERKGEGASPTAPSTPRPTASDDFELQQREVVRDQKLDALERRSGELRRARLRRAL